MNLTIRQKEVLNCVRKENPKILVCSGAKRSGKTFVLNLIFLAHVAKYENQGLSFILGGATQASIKRNVLNELEALLGKDLPIRKDNSVEIFGNRVYVFDGANSDSWKKVRGFTSAGAFLNEGTALNDVFIKECISRCSYPGARIFIDTNPENPAHSLKKDYIDKSGQRLDSGQLNIKAFHFTLFDNTALNEEYVQSIIMSTPSGMFMDRDVHGRWVNAEGVIYADFGQDNYTKSTDRVNFVKYFCGVDWGYEHFGSIVLLGKDYRGKVYLMEEYAFQHKFIDEWIDIAKDIKNRYGNIMFYADSARPEHVQAFKNAGLRCVNAKKNVLEGIETVAKLIKAKDFLVVENKVSRFKDEINQYAWNSKTGEPMKEWDDVLDSVRYGILTEGRSNYSFE